MTARSHLSKAVLRKVSGAPSGGACAVYAGTPIGNVTTLSTATLYAYADPTNTLTLANPFSFTQGQLDFYTAMPARVNLVITPTPVPPATVGTPQTFFAVDLWPSPDDIVMGSQGLLSARPAPSRPEFRFYATDTGLEYLDDGTNWHVIGANPGYENTFLLMGA